MKNNESVESIVLDNLDISDSVIHEDRNHNPGYRF